MRPRIILMSGAPGSGKSTLGTMLAQALRIPFLARDDVRGGLAFSLGAWTGALERLPSNEETVEAFLQTVEGLAGRGVSCVVEYVLRTHRPADVDRLSSAGECIAIVTSCATTHGRLVDRNENDRFLANAAVLRAAGASTIAEHTSAMLERMRRVEAEMMLELPVPTLHVDTTDGYQPSLDAVVAFATAPL